MRTTKNLTISLPPAMLRDMEKAAKKENRTLSELVRENFRRAQKQQDIDIYQFIRQLAPGWPTCKPCGKRPNAKARTS